MIEVEASIIIDRATDEVFEFVSDPTNDPQWHTDIIEVHLPDDSVVKVGTEFTVVARFMGRRTATVEVSDLQPGRRIEYTTKDGPLRPIATCSMEPVDGRTRFTRHVELPFVGLLRLMERAIQGTAQKRQERFVQNLKRLLESPSADTSGGDGRP